MSGKLAEALVRAGVNAADAYDVEEELGLRKEGSVNLTATTSSDGGIAPLRRGATMPVGSRRVYASADRMSDLISWLKPVHMPVLDPKMFIGMTPITSGAMTISHDPTVGEFSGSSIKVAISAAGNFAARLPMPLASEQGVSEAKVKAGGAVHHRIMCDDWSKVTRLYISLTQDAGVTNYWLGSIINSGKSNFAMGNPAYSSRWNNVWRTLALQSKDYIKQGVPEAWGYDSRYFNTDGVYFAAITTGAVNLWIDRIYSPDWPVGVVTPIFDGWYREAQAIAVSDFQPRGWGCGGSANTVGQGSYFPTYSELKAMSDLGFDVFAHGHALGGSSASPMPSGIVATTYAPILAHQRRALAAAGCDSTGLRWHQWLQNLGQGAFDVAAHLRLHGIDAARADTIDGEAGVDPFNSAYTLSMIADSTWVSKRGRYNRSHIAWYNNIGIGANYDAAPIDPAKPTLVKEVEYAAKTGQKLTAYTHRILGSPTANDVSPEFYAAHRDDLAARERSGDLLILNPTDVERLTYWRSGDVYMRWDGEWVYRHDPTKIAF